MICSNGLHMQHTHIQQNGFFRQSNIPNGSQPPGGVRQDKGASKRERIATMQPAPQKPMTRSRHMNSNIPRSQKRSTKRKTVHVTLWMKPEMKAELERCALQDGLSISKFGGVLLEEAMHQKLHIQHAVLIQTIIEQSLDKKIRANTNRLAFLLVQPHVKKVRDGILTENCCSKEKSPSSLYRR
jgi:hypothetical protein